MWIIQDASTGDDTPYNLNRAIRLIGAPLPDKDHYGVYAVFGVNDKQEDWALLAQIIHNNEVHGYDGGMTWADSVILDIMRVIKSKETEVYELEIR